MHPVPCKDGHGTRVKAAAATRSLPTSLVVSKSTRPPGTQGFQIGARWKGLKTRAAIPYNPIITTKYSTYSRACQALFSLNYQFDSTFFSTNYQNTPQNSLFDSNNTQKRTTKLSKYTKNTPCLSQTATECTLPNRLPSIAQPLQQ
jgi:hypothetical protein